MVFDTDNAHRRRSSLVADNPELGKQAAKRKEDTACFVHHLLERERKAKHEKSVSKLQNINEDTKADKSTGAEHGKPTNSRLLTKKQLSDMAWGVRELSKRLGSVRLKLHVKTVFLLTKAHDEGLIGYTGEVVEWLLSKDRPTPYIVYVKLKEV